MNIKRWRPELLLLIAAAFITRFWALFWPNAVVFDEVYFKVFASHYLDGHYFFDIHPPLGKLLLAMWAYILHLSPAAMQNGTVVQLRALPAFAGALLVPVVWGILRRLHANRPLAFLGAACVLLDNALIVESRFILVDSMLILFGFLGVYFYLVARDDHSKRYWAWLALSALFAGASLSTKWTGLNSIAIIFLAWLWDSRSYPYITGRKLAQAALLILIPIALYVSVFWVHFQLLPKSGDGDAFMTTQFQATLVGSRYYNPNARMSFLDKFIELNKEMYIANETLTATHPYGSRWYKWPLEIRDIYYWEGAVLPNGTQGNIYLLGNPAVWWGVWFAILFGFYTVWAHKIHLGKQTKKALILCTVAYLINYVPFIGITRTMFLYHYLFAFVYSIMFAILLWNGIVPDLFAERKYQHRFFYAGTLILIVLTFVYFIPLTYGLPMSPSQLQAHMWLKSWR